jgi:transposase
MENRNNQRLEEITTTTLIVGVDIAKTTHWARFVDYRGVEFGKALSFKSDRQGFESILARVTEICKTKFKKQQFDSVLIGMEPTGHYWKTFANFLEKAKYRVVGVNPYHTKKAKELDDNNPTKNDKKDALTIARLVANGRFFDTYMPQNIYSELRVLTNVRVSIMKRYNATKNIITAILDEYFPEIWTVFANPLKAKSSRQVFRSCPFPSIILDMGEAGVLAEINKAVKKSVGIKKVRQLIEAAESSVGVGYGINAARLRLKLLLEELDQSERHLAEIELSMEQAIILTGNAKQILSIRGVGIVTAASFLGEVGDPLRFKNAKQIVKYAGLNLTEDSSGKTKSGTYISKRGRAQLRSLLYQMAYTMVGCNNEMKALYKYFISRENNPLKKKQALVVISKKIITVIYSLLKKQEVYNPALVLGAIRQEMMAAAVA